MEKKSRNTSINKKFIRVVVNKQFCLKPINETNICRLYGYNNKARVYVDNQIKNLKKIYIRAGDLPKSGKSKNFSTEKLEKGISVYEAVVYKGDIIPILPRYDKINLVDIDILFDRPIYIVKGEKVGTGSIGEPVLKNVKLLEKIKIKIFSLVEI